MDNKAFFARFGDLHAQFRRGTLPARLHAEYNSYCSSLAYIMESAQRASPERLTQRGVLRMAQVLRVELVLAAGKKEKTSTLDIGQEGFAAVVAAAPAPNASVPFVLHLPLGAIQGVATVLSVRPHRGAYRIAFAFETLSQAARDALQIALIDGVLERVQRLVS